jgi:hypothetical protein
MKGQWALPYAVDVFPRLSMGISHHRFAAMRTHICLSLLVLGAVILGSSTLSAQDTGQCTEYNTCALNVVPRWNGLAVVRGADEQHIATLGFLWPGSLNRGTAFAPDAAATALGQRAVRTRRLAAALTDLGALAILAGAARAESSGVDATARTLMISGAVAFGVSVPLQFRADGQLARAVWTYNRRFAAH